MVRPRKSYMKGARRLYFVFLFVCLGFSYSPQEVASNVGKRLSSLRSLEADFEQFYYSAAIATPLQEKGKLYFQKPDLMRWEYLEPEKYVYLYKEGLSLAYFPEDNQLFRHTLTPEERDSELFRLLLGKASLEEAYFTEPASFPSERKNPLQVKLIPKQEGSFTYILLEVDGKTWLIEKLLLFDAAGNKQEFRFSRIKPNPRLGPGVFDLKVPPDCEIIDDLHPLKGD